MAAWWRVSCAWPAVMLLLYAGILALGFLEFRQAATGFIPQLDRGIVIVAAQLPPGAALDRTDECCARRSISRSTRRASGAR